ncbi:unnamed protein product [Malus baccata var. baccata]
MQGPNPKAATELIRVDGLLDALCTINSFLKFRDDELATEVAWVVVYLSALSNLATSMLVKSDVLQLLVQRLAMSNSLQLLIPVRVVVLVQVFIPYILCFILSIWLYMFPLQKPPPGHISLEILYFLVKCLNSEHRVLNKEAAWVLSNIAVGSVEHKQLIYSSEAVPVLLRLLSTAPFDIRREVVYVLGNLCVSPISPTEGDGKPSLILEHLVSLVGRGCLAGFIDLVNSVDTKAARLGLQFTELVLRGMLNGKGLKLVEKENGIDAMERFQFYKNEDLRNMANNLVNKYFGDDYGLDE